MSRHKEFFPSQMHLAPVRLLGGFICVDMHIGCRGCSYCLNRRSPALARILDQRIRFRLRDMGVSVRHLFSLVEQTWSYSRASVPIRCGHLTDWRYQIEETEAFYRMLPADYPFVVLTRFPLGDRQRALARGQPNLLLHVSLTPPIPGRERDNQPPERVIESVASVPNENLFFMCRPLVSGNRRRNEELVDALPPGSSAGFHGISTDGIRAATGLLGVSDEELGELRARARARGVRVLDFFGCALWRRLRRPFFKYEEAAARPESGCVECPNLSVCRDQRSGTTPPRIVTELRRLGIRPQCTVVNQGRVFVETSTPVSRAEEIYLSMMTGSPVTISSVARSAGKGVLIMSTSILDRWQATGFAPVSALRDLSERIDREVAERTRLGAAHI